MKRVICVVGPTATGKTELAVRLAQALDGEVVSCDSMQVYRGMPIGTAQPTPEEQKGIPHHMLAVADPAEAFSVGKFVAQADPIVQDILARGKTAILAGGTGLYVDALAAGRSFAPMPQTGRREALEARADREGIEALLADLRRVDPQSAARLHPGNRRRIIRALEVYEETGRTITQHNLETAARPPRYDAAWLGLDFQDRADLYARIEERVDRMIQAGLLEEVRGLLDRGVALDSTALQAIGYKELVPVLTQGADLPQAIAAVKQNSRRYAKRQRTWFRRNPAVHWLLLPRSPEGETVARQAMDDLTDSL